jgi:4-amino-4-deoxy-L-arabinose transferase-like glycosyltransferase
LKEPSRLPVPVILAALFVFVFTNLFSLLVFDHVPRIHDEISYVFQAEIFHSGRLTVPSPCPPRAFDFTHVINNGRWYGMYPPGFPLLLAAGMAVGTPWIVNPLLAALFIVAVYFLGLELYDRRTGTIAAVLAALSPWALIMSSTLMSHPAGLFFLTVFMLFFFRSLRRPSFAGGLLAGAALGLAFLVRPYSALFLALPFALVYLERLAREPKRFRAAFAGLVLAGLACLAAYLVYNQLTNGSPFLLGHVVAHGSEILPGTGRSSLAAPHTLMAGIVNVGKYLGAMNDELFGWPLTSFLGIFLAFIFFRPGSEKSRRDLLLLASFLSLLVGLALFWGTIILVGARLAYEGIGLLILLSARGLAEIIERTSRNKSLPNRRPRVEAALPAAIFALFTAFAFGIRLPRMISPGESRWYFSGYTDKFAGVTADIDRSVRGLDLGKSLVVMKLLYKPLEFFPDGWWGSGFLYDDPLLRRQVIYANEHALESTEIFRCHPDRSVYLYLGTLEKGLLLPLSVKEGRIAAGPPVHREAETGPSRGRIQWVDEPAGLFYSYSPEFRAFIDGFARETGVLGLDVASLSDEAALARTRGDYKREVFSLEAALQVERNPEFAFPFLNRLANAYFKLGRTSDAQRIRAKILEAGFEDGRVGAVAPDKGY